MGRIQNSDGAQNKHKRGTTGTQALLTGMQGGRATLESRLKVLGKQNKVLRQDPTVWFFGIFSHTADFAVAPLCPTLRDPMSYMQHARPPCPSPTPGVHSDSCPQVGNAIQPSHPLSSPSPPTFNLSQPQGLFQWVRSSPKDWSFSFGISPSSKYSGLVPFGLPVLILLFKGLSRVFSSTFMSTQKTAGWCLQPLCPWLSKFGSNQGVPQ